MRHTPGPWKNNYEKDIGFNDDGAIIKGSNPNEIIVTDIYGRTDKERKANAHLIAAAPELLEACKKLYYILREDEGYKSDNPIMRNALLAITKAEGK